MILRRGRDIKHLKPDVTRAVDKATIELGNTIKENVRKRTPIDKGNAQRGWLPRGTIRKPNWKIENNVEYIGILNEGHSRQAPANFIQQEIKKAIRTQKI